MLREIREEPGITSLSLQFKGFLTWSHLHNPNVGGLYLKNDLMRQEIVTEIRPELEHKEEF